MLKILAQTSDHADVPILGQMLHRQAAILMAASFTSTRVLAYFRADSLAGQGLQYSQLCSIEVGSCALLASDKTHQREACAATFLAMLQN